MLRVMRGTALGAGLAATVLFGGLTALLLTAAPAGVALWVLPAGWSFLIAGLILWASRPDNRTGPLMVLTAFALFASRLTFADQDQIRSIGQWLSSFHLALLVHTLLALPGGRLGSRLARAIVIGIYLDFGPLNHAWLVLGPDGLGGALRQASLVVGVVLLGAGAALLVQRWRTGTAAWRAAVAPVLWPGALTLGALVAWGANAALGVPVGQAPSFALQLAFLAMPYAFLAVLLRRHFARASFASLMVELDESRSPGTLRDALARTLGDPTLEVAYWLPETSRYVDVDGQSIVPPEPGSGRTATVVRREGRVVAAVIHDDAISDEPELIRAATAAAGFALDNERLQAELRARVDELAASRARVVRATDLERKRIERNLHDGIQQRLTSIALGLGLVESKLSSDPRAAIEDMRQARASLGLALRELRDISQGIHPGTLTSRGLAPALRDLAYESQVPVSLRVDLDDRLPETVEAGAYYVVAEALANVTKHAHASGASVTAVREDGRIVLGIQDDGVGGADPTRGSGLRGLSDRVQALGGTLVVDSPPGRGTLVRAVIPCA
jgi:signal transduction histidine kinase